MNLTIYERIHAYQYVYDQSLETVIKELGLYGGFNLEPSSQAVINAKFTFDQKKVLSEQKKNALTNISNKVIELSDSNVSILNKAFETARKSFIYRQNLELSILMSELKSLEIQELQIKKMTASEFTKIYGA